MWQPKEVAWIFPYSVEFLKEVFVGFKNANSDGTNV
jgi:hypothetical protein